MEHPQSNLKTESSGTEGFAQTAIKFWESRNFSKRAEEPALPTSKATKSTPEDRMAEQSTSGTEPGTQTSSDSQDRLESASVPVGKAIERAHGLRQLSIVSEDSEHSLPTASDLGDKSRKNSDSGGVTLNYAQEVTQMQSATVESEVEVQSRRGSIQTIAESTAFKLDPFASWQPPQREESPGSVQGGVPIDPGVGDGVQNYVAQNSVSGLNTPVRQPSSDLRGHSRNVDPAGSEDEAAGVRTTSQHALQESDRRLVYDHPMMWQTDPQRTSPSTVSPGRMSGGQPSNSQGVSPLKNVVSSSLVGDNDDGDGEGFSNVLNEGGGAAAPPVQAGIPSTQGMSYTRIPTVSNSVSRRVLGDLFPTSQVAGNLGKRMPHSSGLTIAQGQEQQGVPQAAAIPGFSYQQQTQGNRSAGQETFNTPQWGGSAFGLRPDVELKRRIGILDQYGYKSLSELRAAFSTGANRAKGNTFVGTPTHQPALNFTSHHNTLHHHYPNTSLAYQNPYTFNTPSPYYTREVTSQTAGGKAKMAGRDTEQESLVEDFQNLGRAGRQTQSPTRMGPPSRRGQPYRPQTPENRQSSVDFPFPDDEHPFLQSSPQAQIARNKAAGLDLFGRPLNHSQQNQAQNQAQHQSQSHTRLSALREIGQSAEQRAAIAQGYSQLHYQRDDSHNTQRRHLTINTSMQNNQRDDNEAEGSSSQYLDYGLTHGPGGNIEIQPRHPIVLTPSRTGHQSHIQGVSSPYGYSQYGQQQGTHQTPQLHQTHSGGAFHPTPSNFAQPSGPGRPQRHRTSQLNAQAASFSSTRTPQAQLRQPQLGQATSGSQQSGYPQFEQSPSVFTPSNQAVYASPVLPGPSVFNTHVPGLPPSAFGGFHPYVPHPAWPEPDTLTTWDPDSLQQTGGASVLEALGSVQDIAPNALYSRAPVPGERSHFRPVLSIIPRGLSNHPDLADPSTIGNDGPSTMIPRRRAVNTTALNATAVTTVAPTYSVVVFADLRNVAGGHAPQRPYHPGTDRMFPIPSVQGTSVRLQQLIRNGRPSFEKVILPYFFPFFEVARNAEPHKWGVIKITNIPYNVTKQDIMGFLGRNAKTLSAEIGEAIHIMMERNTGKTMDCYVEFFSHADAAALVNRMTRAKDEEGRHIKLADRHVDVELSSQAALLRDLFPRARNVSWNGSRPEVYETDEPFNSGFKTIITDEELIQMVKYAEQPQRLTEADQFGFSQKCPNRTYENMISVLHKFPWFATNLYTIHTRDELCSATYLMLQALVHQLQSGGFPHQLNDALLQDLLYAGLNAPGFSGSQKWKLAIAAGYAGNEVRMSQQCENWPYHTIGRKANWDEDVIRYFAQIHNTGCLTIINQTLPFPPVNPMFEHLPPQLAVDTTNMTMEQCAIAEWAIMEKVLKSMLRRSSSG